MADEPAGGDNQQQPDNGGAAFERHQAIPETFVKDGKEYDYEAIGGALTEAQTLKAAADERAKLIPAKAEDYQFAVPKDFKLPEGYKWTADANDPTVAGFRTLASELKLTQPEVEKLVAFEATRQANEITAQKAFDAEQTKALGANAEQRRKAASDWIDGVVKNKEAAAVVKTMLTYALGVEGIESIIDGSKVAPRGGAGADEQGDGKKAALKDQVGKPGGASAILREAHKG